MLSLVAHSPANHCPPALRSTKDAALRQPPSPFSRRSQPLVLRRPRHGAARYAPQMLATRRFDNTAIEAAYAAAPREAFLGPRLDDRSPFRGALPHVILVKPRPSRKVSGHATAIAAPTPRAVR